MVKTKDNYTTPKISVVYVDVFSCLCTSDESTVDALVYDNVSFQFEED